MLELVVKPAPQLTIDAHLESLLDALLAVLKQDVEIYRELLANINEKRGVLIAPSLERLTESNGKAETCFLKARMLEEVRSNIVRKIAKSLAKEEKDITLTMLSAYAEGQQRAELQEQQRALSSLVGSIRATNEKNNVLIDHSLSHITGTIKFIHSLLSTGADYANNGRLNAGNRNGSMLYQKG